MHMQMIFNLTLNSHSENFSDLYLQKVGKELFASLNAKKSSINIKYFLHSMAAGTNMHVKKKV